jgi:molybdenum cofactor cytidylyltransferase
MTPFAPLAAVLLAAGFSRRMGGENKLLKPLHGKPLIAHTLDIVARLGLGQLVVVLGESADALAPLLPRSAAIVRNSRDGEGMGASLAAGAAAVTPDMAGDFVVLADMPFVTRADYERLVTAFEAQERRSICAPLHEGQRGHPVLFRACDLPALASLQGDSGARRVLADRQRPVYEVEGCSAGVLTDFDEPASFDVAASGKTLPK